MNKDCILLQYYISDYEDEYILNNCIDSLNKFNLDILLISHSTISEKIQKKVKYYFYDSEDEMINFEDIYKDKVLLNTDKYFMFGDMIASCFMYKNEISYSFYKAMYNIHKISLAMGYENSYYFIGDFEINESEILNLKKIPELLLENNKLGYFEKSYPNGRFLTDNEKNRLTISPFFWYVKNKWFIENFFFDMENKDSYMRSTKELNLNCNYENLLEYKVKKNIDNLILREVEHWGHPVDVSRSDLSKNKKNVFYGNYSSDIGVFYKDNEPYIFAFNNADEVNWTVYLEYENGEYDNHYINVPKNNWIMNPIILKYDKFIIKFIKTINNEVVYKLHVDNIEKFKKTFQIRKL